MPSPCWWVQDKFLAPAGGDQPAVLLWYYTGDVTQRQQEVRLGPWLGPKGWEKCWKSRDRTEICGAGHWALGKWVNSEVLGGDIKKEWGEWEQRTRWAGRVGERHTVILGSVGDWKLGKGGNWDMTNPQQGWNEWNRDGRWPGGGRNKMLSDADGVGQPYFPWA